jgi:hypothetical protein
MHTLSMLDKKKQFATKVYMLFILITKHTSNQTTSRQQNLVTIFEPQRRAIEEIALIFHTRILTNF